MCFSSNDDQYFERPRPARLPKSGTNAPYPSMTGYYAPPGPAGHPPQMPMDDTHEKVANFMAKHEIPQQDGLSNLSSVFQWVNNTLLVKDKEIDVIKRSKREEIDRITTERYAISQERDRFRGLLERDRADLAECQEGLYQANAEIERLRVTIEDMKWAHGNTLAKNKKKYEESMDDQDRKHQDAVRKLKSEIDDLKERISEYSSRDSAVITDESFRTSLLSLSQQLLKLVDHIPKPIQQQQDTRAWSRFVRSLCWTHLLQGFYHYPLGFGIFGAEGEAHVILSHFHEIIAEKPHDDLNRRQVNEGRGFFFERILDDFQNNKSNSEKAFTSYFRDNIERVTQGLVRALQQCFGQTLDSQVNKRIWTVVRDAGVLALQMGSQRSHVLLQACVRGDIVQLKHMFEDETSPSSEEVKVIVDLMTQPCLMRIGNGKEDLTREQVIVKGTIIPLKAGD
ncbi:hypothetical protein B0T21DRAFT_315912 [Apiosordaria backusii]|uniref:Uncharacterized protein n=1 Tax=Apiosordaria backusii TaxID=314023 RepID=A0AA40B2P7_9PEZI|nr:hypothetical protein B0T21DRAFT_315912 [Apiosordaria backusii]